MKIVFVNRYAAPDESATSRIIAMLTGSLAWEGWDLHVLASRNLHDDPAVLLPKVSAERGAIVHRLRSSRFGRKTIPGRAVDQLTFHVAVFFALLRLARRGDVCVVCTDPPLVCVTAGLAAAIKGARTVQWAFDLYPEAAIQLGVLPKRGLAGRIATRLRDLAYRRSEKIVVPIGRMGRVLEERGLATERIAFIPNWSDGDAIRPTDPRRSTLREEWGLDGKFVVAYSGNLGRAHEFDTLIEAADRLRGREDIVFLFIGGGHKRAGLEREVRLRGLANVMFKPLQPAERLSESLSTADLHVVSLLPEMEPYVVPSKFYGIAAAGRPTLFIGDPDGEIARLVKDGECGVAVPIGAAAAVADAVLDLAGSPMRRIAMGHRARSLFEARFTRRIAAAEWVALLREVDAAAEAAPAQGKGA